MLRLTARQRILELLQKETPVSAAQIGRAIKISAASVRHHLRFLMADGRIVMAGETHRGGRGRPTKLYRLSERLLGDNMAMLSDTLLVTWPRDHAAPRGDALAKTLAQGLLRQIGAAEGDSATAKRLASLVARLSALHYQARWEAGAQGPRVLFGHCPYAEIIEAHPELCLMDGEMLAQRMGSGAKQVAKIDRRVGGPRHCVFVLG